MSDKKLFIKASLFASVCGMLITVIFTGLFACVILATGILSNDIINYVTIGVIGVGTLFAGFISARITKSAGLIVGLLSGFIMFMIIIVIGMIKSNEAITLITLFKFIISITAGSIGGVIGVNKKEKIHIK